MTRNQQQSGMNALTPPKRKDSRFLFSWLMLAAGGLVIALVGLSYYQDRRDQQQVPTPEIIPGHYQLANIADVLRKNGVAVNFEPVTVRSEQLTAAGQKLGVSDASLFVFIYPDTASREIESQTMDPATFTLTTPSGTFIDTEPLHIVSHGNVIVALVGGSTDLSEKIDHAIQGLP